MERLWGYLAIAKRIFSTRDLPIRLFLSLSVLALLGGCAGADVAVQSTRLPVPVVEPLPISVGIHLSDEVRTFAHEEAIRDYGTFKITVGPTQDLMFNNLAEGLFANHRFLADTASRPNDVNAILVPSIGELQFSIPAQTKSDFFEVWLSYDFQLLSPDGAPIAQWPMKAYGRANARNYGFLEDTENGALQEAARVALRDAMAVFTFKFKRVPGVQQWLQQFTGPAQSNPSQNEADMVLPQTQDAALNDSGEK